MISSPVTKLHIDFRLTLLVPEKSKKSIFLRPTSAKSINPLTIRKLIEYSLKNIPVKAMFTITVFEILLFEGRSVLSLTQQGTGSERVSVKNQKNVQI